MSPASGLAATSLSTEWPADLLLVVPPSVAPGFRLAGARTVAVGDAARAAEVVQAEVALRAPGVIAVHAGLWADIPTRLRDGWEQLRIPLVLSLPDEDSRAAADRRDRVRNLLARSVGYEIAFIPEGEPS